MEIQAKSCGMHAIKAVLKGNFIAINAYIKNLKRP